MYLNFRAVERNNVCVQSTRSAVEYFRFKNDEWKVLAVADSVRNFTVNEYRRDAEGFMEIEPTRTMQSGTTGFVVEIYFHRHHGSAACFDQF